MNILVPHSWLLDFLKTSASPETLARTVSLCGPSFERSHRQKRDTIYDIEITTNRPDTASVIGIAREAATILSASNLRARFVDPYPSKLSFPIQTTKPLPISIKAKPDTVNRFTAIVIDNVIVKPSPAKIARRLEAVGIRPINNIVDLTNYLMVETGQPLHAFDYDAIIGHAATVDLSLEGETMTTLDNQPHKLPSGAIIIRDSDRIIDLAGIMGGQNSQITSKTQRILLTSAAYNPKRIRSASLKLAHRTQAATLFEKGIDPELSLKVLHRAAQLLIRLSPTAKIASDLVDIYPKPVKNQTVILTHNQLENYLGTEIKPAEVIKILNNLQIQTSFSKTDKTYHASMPSHRATDIEISQDLIEEIARIFGYHKLPSILPPNPEQTLTSQSSQFSNENLIKKLLILHGFSEVYTSPLVTKEQIISASISPESALKLKNPLSENAFLRPSLLPSLSSAVNLNLKYTSHFSLFELANIYLPKKGSPLPEEIVTLGLFTNQYSASEFKGIIEQIFNRLGLKYKADYKQTHPEFDAQQALTYTIGHTSVAVIGVQNNQKEQGFYATVNLNIVLKNPKPKVSFQPIPTYPPTFEDITIQTKADIKIGKLVDKIKSVSAKITNITYVEGFKQKTNIAHTFRLELRDSKKTITKDEASLIKAKILSKFK